MRFFWEVLLLFLLLSSVFTSLELNNLKTYKRTILALRCLIVMKEIGSVVGLHWKLSSVTTINLVCGNSCGMSAPDRGPVI